MYGLAAEKRDRSHLDASNHCKPVGKAVCLAVGRHRRYVSDAIIVFYIKFCPYNLVRTHLLSFASRSRISGLESSVRTACFLFPAYCMYNRLLLRPFQFKHLSHGNPQARFRVVQLKLKLKHQWLKNSFKKLQNTHDRITLMYTI